MTDQPVLDRREVFYQTLLGIDKSFTILMADAAIRRELRLHGYSTPRPKEVREFLEELVDKGELRYAAFGENRRYSWVNDD